MVDNPEPARNPHTRRAKAAALAARREAARAKARQRIAVAVSGLVVVVVVVIVLAVTLSGRHSHNTVSTGALSTSAPTAGAAPTGGATACAYTPNGTAAKNVGTPPTSGIAAGTYTAKITTNQGVVTLDLDATKAPCTVNSFVYLASKGYFDNTPCHRLTTSGIFVLQCGDPSGTGTGGPGYSFADENLAGATYPAGTVAMANAGPNTNGSQFFLVYKDTQLSPNYTPFGKVTGGLDVLASIAAKGTADGGPDGAPKDPVTITSVTASRDS